MYLVHHMCKNFSFLMMNIVNGTPYSSKLMSVWAYTVVAVNVTRVIAVLFFFIAVIFV